MILKLREILSKLIVTCKYVEQLKAGKSESRGQHPFFGLCLVVFCNNIYFSITFMALFLIIPYYVNKRFVGY